MKQIIVMRTDLNMRKGKMVAQGAHASMGAVLPFLTQSRPAYYTEAEDERRRLDCVNAWLADSFTKVVVRVDSLDELMAVRDNAEGAGLTHCVITDNGKTEFNGVPTITCCAIGPDTAENLAPVTGHLKLL